MADYNLEMPTCRDIDIRDLSIAQLQEHMMAGTFSAWDLTACFLERVKRVNGILKYVVLNSGLARGFIVADARLEPS